MGGGSISSHILRDPRLWPLMRDPRVLVGTVRESQRGEGWRVLVLREGEGGRGQGRGRCVGAGGRRGSSVGRGPCARFHPPAQAGPKPPWAQWPFQMMDRRGCPGAGDVGLHLASIAPQGPRSMAAHDEWLRIDFHLIDNLVNLFAESQVGPERKPRGNSGVDAPRAGVAARGQQRSASHGVGGGSARAHGLPNPSPSNTAPAWGTHCSRVCVQGRLSSLWSGTPGRVGAGCSDHSGLKSPVRDLIPGQPISCITRVLPLSHSDPQFLFCRVDPTQACPSTHSAHFIAAMSVPPHQLSGTLPLLALTSFQVLGHA